MVQGSDEQSNRGAWETGARALASRIASRHLGLTEWITGHAASPLKTMLVGGSRDDATLARQISQRAGWCNALAHRVSGLSHSISRSLQRTGFTVQTSSADWFNRERANRLQFEADTAPHVEFPDLPGKSEGPEAPLAARRQQGEIERFPVQSSSVYEAQDERRTGTTYPMRRAIVDAQQPSRPKAVEFATAHRARIQRLPAIAKSQPMLQGKEILSSDFSAEDESIAVPSSEFRLFHKPARHRASERDLGSRHQSYTEGEIAQAGASTTGSGRAETGRGSVGEGDSPIVQRHQQEDVPSSAALKTGSETDLTPSVGKYQPDYKQSISLTSKGRSIALSSSSMGLLSQASKRSSIPLITSRRPLPFLPSMLTLRRSPAPDDERGEPTQVQTSFSQEGIFSSTPLSEGPSIGQSQPLGTLRARPETAGQPRSDAPVVKGERTDQAVPRTVSTPTGEGLAETVAAKYGADTAPDRRLTAGPLSLIQPFAARSQEMRARIMEGATVSPTSEGMVQTQSEEELSTALTGKYEPDRVVPFSKTSKPLSLIQHPAVIRPSESSSRISRRTMGQGLSKEVAEKYLPEETITRSLATERLSTVEPFIAPKSHEAPTRGDSALDEEKVFDYFPQKHGMPGWERAEESGIPSSSLIPSSSEARTIHREVYGGEALHKEAGDWALPTLVTPRTAAPEGVFRAYEPIEPILARFADRPYAETVDHEMAMAPIQRTETQEPTSGISRAGEGEEWETEDMEELAREVYTIIKRRLDVERERVGCR